MKAHLPLLLIAFVSALPAADETPSIVRFANEDRLSGSLESLSADLLVWKSPALEKPTPFLLKNVIDLTLPTPPHDVKADHQAILTLTNGDTIRGQLASVSAESVSLDTWFAGRMNFNRLMVSGLRIEARRALVYQGPTGMDGWQQPEGRPAWKYRNLAFISKAAGTIARDGLLTDEDSVSFDVAWKSDAISLKVLLFADGTDAEHDSGYELTFTRGNIKLRNCKADNHIGNAHSRAMMENDKVRVELRASRKSGKVCLYINGRILEVWTDPDLAKGGFGQALHFISQNSQPLRISAISVAPWDGVIEEVPEPRVGMMRQFGRQGLLEETNPAPREKPGEGRMELANGDSIQGEVSAIQEGVITLKSPLGDISLPVARLRIIALAKVDPERCKRRNGDIRAWFSDGSSVVFRLDSVGDGTLTGYSQNFGTASFKTAAFNRIEFNIYDPEMEDKRLPEDW
jgi:hypothetical protein